VDSPKLQIELSRQFLQWEQHWVGSWENLWGKSLGNELVVGLDPKLGNQRLVQEWELMEQSSARESVQMREECSVQKLVE
jgi:hypothetical protein